MSQTFASLAQAFEFVPGSNHTPAIQTICPKVTQPLRVSIARDLHDSIGHTLTALSLHLELSSRGDAHFIAGEKTLSMLCDKLKTDLKDCLAQRKNDKDVLQLVVLLMSEMVPDSSVHLQSSIPLSYLAPAVLHQVELIVREAINNYVKYAGQSQLRVSINKIGKSLQITVADDGRGFDPKKGSPGFGIQGMKERAQLICASLIVASKPGQGTSVVITLPMDSTPNAECNISYTRELKEQINGLLSNAIGLHLYKLEEQISLLAASTTTDRATRLAEAGATVRTMLKQVRNLVKDLRAV